MAAVYAQAGLLPDMEVVRPRVFVGGKVTARVQFRDGARRPVEPAGPVIFLWRSPTNLIVETVGVSVAGKVGAYDGAYFPPPVLGLWGVRPSAGTDAPVLDWSLFTVVDEPAGGVIPAQALWVTGDASAITTDEGMHLTAVTIDGLPRFVPGAGGKLPDGLVLPGVTPSLEGKADTGGVSIEVLREDAALVGGEAARPFAERAEEAAEQVAADATATEAARAQVVGIRAALPGDVAGEIQQQAPVLVGQEVQTQVKPEADRAVLARQVVTDIAAGLPAATSQTIGSGGTGIANTGLWAFGRDSVRGAYDAGRTYIEVLPDQAQRTANTETGAPLGVAFDPASANLVRSSRGDGAVVGVLGSGGALPTYMATDGTGGLTIEVLSTNTTNGCTETVIRISGTATGAICAFLFDAANMVPATAGLKHTLSFDFRRIASPLPVNSWRYRTTGRTAAAGTVSGNTFTSTTFTPTTTRARFQSTVEFTGDPTLVRAGVGIGGVLTTTRAYDETFAISSWQFEQRPQATRYMRSLPGLVGTAPRSADTARIPAAAAGSTSNFARGTLTFAFSTLGAFVSALDAEWLGLFGLGDATAANGFGAVLRPDHTGLELRWVKGGVANAAASVAMAVQPADTLIRAGFAWDGTKMQIAARGVAGASVPITVGTPGVTEINPGLVLALYRHTGAIRDAAYRDAPFFDTNLATLCPI